MHSEGVVDDHLMYGDKITRTIFTKGGLCAYKDELCAGPEHYNSTFEKQAMFGRDGYFGWMGVSGSIF